MQPTVPQPIEYPYVVFAESSKLKPPVHMGNPATQIPFLMEVYDISREEASKRYWSQLG